MVIAIALGIGASVIYNLKYDEWVAIPKARESFRSQLRDPGSAQFRNERITKAGALCGEVNAKNGMGGYVGFKKYISHGAGSFVEGTWLLGEAPHDRYMQHLNQRLVITKRYATIRKDFPDVESPSTEAITEMASVELFEDEWRNTCT